MTYNAYKLLKKIKQHKVTSIPEDVKGMELHPYTELTKNHYIIVKDNQDVKMTVKGLSALSEYAFQRRQYLVEFAIAVFTFLITLLGVLEQVFFQKP